MKHLFSIFFTALIWLGGLQAQTLPIQVNEQNPLTKFSVEAPSDTCDAIVALTVFDPDFTDEGSFFWNSYEHFLYSDTAGRSVSQLSQPDLPFEVLDGQTIIYFVRVPRSEVLAGENVVQFQHNGSAGSTISGFNVSYDCAPNAPPALGDSTGGDSLAVCYLTKAQVDSIQAWLDAAVCIDSSEVSFGDTLAIGIVVDDTTFVPVTVTDTSFNIVEINDTIRNSITIRDTLFLTEFDTTLINEVIVNFDTTSRDTLIFSDTLLNRVVITALVTDTVPASLCPPVIVGGRDTLIVSAVVDTVFEDTMVVSPELFDLTRFTYAFDQKPLSGVGSNIVVDEFWGSGSNQTVILTNGQSPQNRLTVNSPVDSAYWWRVANPGEYPEDPEGFIPVPADQGGGVHPVEVFGMGMCPAGSGNRIERRLEGQISEKGYIFNEDIPVRSAEMVTFWLPDNHTPWQAGFNNNPLLDINSPQTSAILFQIHPYTDGGTPGVPTATTNGGQTPSYAVVVRGDQLVLESGSNTSPNPKINILETGISARFAAGEAIQVGFVSNWAQDNTGSVDWRYRWVNRYKTSNSDWNVIYQTNYQTYVDENRDDRPWRYFMSYGIYAFGMDAFGNDLVQEAEAGVYRDYAPSCNPNSRAFEVYFTGVASLDLKSDNSVIKLNDGTMKAVNTLTDEEVFEQVFRYPTVASIPPDFPSTSFIRDYENNYFRAQDLVTPSLDLMQIGNGISDIAVDPSKIDYTQYLNGMHTPEQIKKEAEANW